MNCFFLIYGDSGKLIPTKSRPTLVNSDSKCQSAENNADIQKITNMFLTQKIKSGRSFLIVGIYHMTTATQKLILVVSQRFGSISLMSEVLMSVKVETLFKDNHLS